MINNDTLATASIFGISAGVVTEAWSSIIVGAVAVGIMQPFFRILFTKLFNKFTKDNEAREETMAYKKRRKSSKKKKDDKKKKKRKSRRKYGKGY